MENLAPVFHDHTPCLVFLCRGSEKSITWHEGRKARSCAYRRLGGGRLALANSADELYEKLIPEEQITCKRILLRLVRPGDAVVAGSLGPDVNWFDFFAGRGAKNLFYIKTVDENALDPGRREDSRLALSDSLEKIFTESMEKFKQGEVTEIKSPGGATA